MRSLDYLASRPEVDASRIGAAGLLWWRRVNNIHRRYGPETSKLLFPPVIPVLLSHCYPTSGPDGEMVFPHFLASGLDTADFVELSAPTPWLLQSTETDQYHFSHEGVKLVYERSPKVLRTLSRSKEI